MNADRIFSFYNSLDSNYLTSKLSTSEQISEKQNWEANSSSTWWFHHLHRPLSNVLLYDHIMFSYVQKTSLIPVSKIFVEKEKKVKSTCLFYFPFKL